MTRVHTRRAFLATGGAALAGFYLAACSSGGGNTISSTSPVTEAKVDGDLDYINWEGYISDEVISGFEQEYGVKVNQTYFSSFADLHKKLAAGQPYDVTVTASQDLPRLTQNGLLQPVNHDLFENLDQVPAAFQNPQLTDDEKLNEQIARHLGGPYAYGDAGIQWLTNRVPDPQPSYRAFWDAPEQADGHIFLFDDPTYTIGVALGALGHPVQSSDPKQIDEAAAALIELKPKLGGFTTQQSQTKVESGDSWLGFAWAGNMYLAYKELAQPETLGWAPAKEGGYSGSDFWTIPASAKHPGTATLFLDWLLRPENATKNVDTIAYPIPTTAGLAAYADLTKDIPWLQVDEASIADFSRWTKPLDQQTAQRWQQTWTKVRAA